MKNDACSKEGKEENHTTSFKCLGCKNQRRRRKKRRGSLPLGEKGVFMSAATGCQIGTPFPFTPVEVHHDGHSGDGYGDGEHREANSSDAHPRTNRGG
jgi:hypothetical protein